MSQAHHSIVRPAGGNERTASDWRTILDLIRRRDPFGDRLHFALAIVYLMAIPMATAPASISFGLLFIWSCVRLRWTLPCYQWLWRDRLVWLLGAWAAWQAASILWSINSEQGLDEITSFRVLLTPFLLLPVLDRITWLVAAFLMGVAFQNIVQLGQWMQWLPQHGGDGGRIRGLIHPIQTGAMCAAAMCWHLSGTLHGGRWLRWISMFGFILAGFGLVVSGSRGPWISAAAAITLGLFLIAWRNSALRKRTVLFIAVVGIAALVIVPLSREMIIKRYRATMQDFRNVEKGRYRSDIGYRLASWNAGWSMFLRAPLQGVGAGGFHDAVVKQPDGKMLRNAKHAHSTYVHVLACTGVVGGLLAGICALGTLRRAWGYRAPGIYADGFLLVLITWLVGAASDSYHLNGLLFGLFGFVVTATLPVWKLDAPHDFPLRSVHIT